jgi:hypothetical protein
MARWLTPLRAILVASLGGLVLGLALRGEARSPRPGPLSMPETRGRVLLERHASAAHGTWRTTVVVDSLRRRLPPATEPVTFVVGPAVPAARAEAVRRGVARAWQGITHAPGGARVTVALILDTAGVREWNQGKIMHVVPSGADEPCLTVIQLGPAALNANWRFGDLTGNGALPGLCGLVAQAGPPGVGIADWLHASGGAFAHRVVDRTDFLWLPASLRLGDLRWELRSEVGRALSSCIAGRPLSCEMWISRYRLATPEAHRLRAAVGLVTQDRIGWGSAWWSGEWASGLLLDQGSEPFRRFWSSDQPVAEAFQEAFGLSMGAWTVNWLRERGLEAPREVRSPWRAAPITLLVALMFAGGALAYSTQRTVSA